MKLKVLGISVYDGRQSYEVEYEGQKRFVNLYKFQEGEVLPKELDCNVKDLGEGKVSITQNIIPYLEERYSLGETYEFIVRNDFSRSGYYELIDQDGFYFRLNSMPGMVLYIGQEVTCRVIDMQGANVKLDLLSCDKSDEKLSVSKGIDIKSAQITESFLVDYIKQGRFQKIDLLWDLSALIQLVFLNDETYASMVNEYILNQIKKLKQEYDYEQIIVILKEMRDAILYVLEETDCLSNCDVNQRKVLQSRLSIIGVTIKSYVKVIGYFSNGQVEEKVNRLLHNLEVSGYVFQAESQLGMMMLIFSLDNEMMESQMATLFKIIHSKDGKYWKDEPFRTAFIKLLELFIERKKEQIDLAIHDVENVKGVLEALSIQLLLSNTKDDSEIFDYNLNRAMFYRYASYLKTSTPKYALDNAFLSLMDVNQAPAEYSWNDTASHELLASKLSSDIRKAVTSTYTKVYKEGNVKLEISDAGIVLQSLQVPEEKLKNVLPVNMLPWNHIQVRMQATLPTINSSKKTDLIVYRQLWNQMERELFEDNKVKVKQIKEKKRPVIGEFYGVRVLYKDEYGRLVCQIVDDNCEGEGYLSPKDIVPYNINMHPSLFKNRQTGQSLLIEGKVLSISPEGKCQFTLQPYLNETLKESINYTNRMPCIITGINENGYLGVNSVGASVRFTNSEDFPNLHCNDMVFATDWEFYGNSCYSATIQTTEEVASHVFTVEEAFNRLMDEYSYDDYTDVVDNADSEVVQQETLLDRSKVKELMNLIDRVASLENEYLVTYNYLGFAKMLARLVNDEKRYGFYSGWMNLIAILHHFAVNAAVPTKDLNEFENSSMQLFSKYSEIYKKYMQLKIVSFKGKVEYNNQLWEFSRHDDEVIRGLAQCVLAYNLLGTHTDSHTRQNIEEHIADFLKVKDYSSKLHDFGTEDLHNEFKMSLVYPSNNNMQPNLEKQTYEIMQEVCAMLNAEGGCLYIGVNDCGVGVGMNDDLSYSEFRDSHDKYDLYFRNQICQNFGRDVDAYVKSGFKEYERRTIYVIEIKAYPYPVRLDGVIYERHGTSKVALEGENERLFEERRKEFFADLQQTENSCFEGLPTNGTFAAVDERSYKNLQKLKESLMAKESGGSKLAGATNAMSEPTGVKARKEDMIEVSKLRPATPMSYDDNPTIIRYIQFMNHSYQMLTDYYGADEKVFLTLAIEEEDRDKYLILAYEDGKVCRIPIAILLDKEDYQTNARYSEKKLVFAEIASEDDLLMSIGLRKRIGESMRFDTVGNLVLKETLTSVGEPVCCASFESYVQFDIVPAKYKSDFKECTDLNMKQPGRSITKNKDDKFCKKLKKLGIM